jgi:hypothetical protein
MGASLCAFIRIDREEKMMLKPWDHGRLQVSPNQKNLVNGEASFFWLGDTAWNLFQRLDRDEAYVYLRNRKEKGFNVIQAVLINYAHEGNKRSLQHVENEDVLQVIRAENKLYWDHVETIVDMAAEMGIYFALLPVWGRVVKEGYLNTDNVAPYADYLTRVFGGKKNIIWLLGGDIRGDLHEGLWNTLGKALKSAMPDTLVGYHPFGRTSSSYWFSDCDWLDLHMFQSGHRRYDQNWLKSWDDATAQEPWFGEDNWRYVVQDRMKTPRKPVVDGEPSYEQIPQGLHNPSEPYWQAHHVRRYAYWSVLSGSMGHTYGHNAIFQFNKDGYEPEFGSNVTWEEALHASGGSQMQILKSLMLEIDFVHGDAMQELLHTKESGGEKEHKVLVFGNSRNIVCYTYSGRPFTIRIPDAGNRMYQAYWIDPVSGSRSYLGQVSSSEAVEFVPPPKDTDFTDWLLHLKEE